MTLPNTSGTFSEIAYIDNVESFRYRHLNNYLNDQFGKDVFSRFLDFRVDNDAMDLLEKLFLKDEFSATQLTQNRAIYRNGPEMAFANFNNHSKNIGITLYATSIKRLDHWVNTITGLLHQEARRTVKWYYQGPRGLDYSFVSVSGNQQIQDEYYPYINGGVDNFCEEYINSSATVLLLFGEPGTGKTTFIRNFIHKHRMDTILTYDEGVMKSDNFLIEFLTSDEDNLLLVEDADVLLTSRERDKNDIMSKLLNAADGLVKFPTKKIIFTTNLTNMSQVDSALTRPGRCFGMVNFRPLKYDEAKAAAAAAGLDEPTEQRNYTLAEIFNNNQPNNAKISKMGFV